MARYSAFSSLVEQNAMNFARAPNGLRASPDVVLVDLMYLLSSGGHDEKLDRCADKSARTIRLR